ncbi:MAG: ABC transporter permease [Thermotogae bacterium]|jgi:ribose/xylose/arabinose/galactoside ABC-type transport system permease subunit|nr:ABC transporter permease [Thermotogota bacterium]
MQLFKRRESIILFFIVALIIIFSIVTSGRFASYSNIIQILVNAVPIIISSIGMTMIIITAGIDVSAGSIVGLVGMTVSVLSLQGIWSPYDWIIGLLLGGLLGFFNALLIWNLKIAPIIATLATMGIYRSLVFTVSGGRWAIGMPTLLLWIGSGTIFNIPFSIFLMVAFVIYFIYFMSKRVTGRNIYAIGNNIEAARTSGVSIGKTIFFIYTLAGVLYAVSAFAILGRTGLAQSTMGTGFELEVIAAVVIGGTNILGGEGTIVGSLIGALLVAVIEDGIVLSNIPPLLTDFVLGALILIAISTDVIIKRREIA